MADSPYQKESPPVDHDWYALDLIFIDDLLSCGYHLVQGPIFVYLQEAPQFELLIRPGYPLEWWHENNKLTKEVWFDRLIERAYERQARLIERALNGD